MSLTEMSYYFRKIAPFAILGIIVVFILWYSIQLVILLVQLQKPAETPIASIVNPVFGQIPNPVVPNSTPSGNLIYVLDTIDGVTVTATEAAGVYLLPKVPARFGYRENANLMAKALDINTELTKFSLQGDIAVFSDAKNKMTVNINNYNFEYEYTYLANDKELLDTAYIPPERDITTNAIEIMSRVGRYPAELARGKTNIIYLAFNPDSSELTVVDKPDVANMVEVDFYREDIGEFPVATSRYFNSSDYAVLVFQPGGYKVVKAKVAFYEKSDEQYGIYPIKNGDQAWTDFTSGKGIIVSGGNGLSTVNIKKMFMAYYDPDIEQDYLQPVYVFLGDNNFVGYLPAITDEYQTTATPEAIPTIDDSPTTVEVTLEPTIPVINNISTVEADVSPTEGPTVTPPQSPTPTKKSSGAVVKTLAPTASPTP